MGYGGKYGQQFGLDEAPLVPTSFEFRRDETVTAVDTLPDHGVPNSFRMDEVVTAVDAVVYSPQAYSFQSDETLSATDGASEVPGTVTGDDWPTGSATSFVQYDPVVDLNMVEARLTNRARYYLARGIHDGTLLQPVSFDLGVGWENPRWGEPPKPSPDATEVANKVYEGSLWDGRMYMEEANASTLVIRCAGPDAPIFTPTELMIYAEIRHSSNPDENYHQIPFANATFPSWFYTTNQRFVTRIVLPLGCGARVPLYRRPPLRIIADTVSAVDSVTVDVDFDVFAVGGE